MSESQKTKIYAIFHLNLAYSSIDKHHHAEVIERCYWPLLRLCRDHSIPIGIEASSFTLRCIEAASPEWLSCLHNLLRNQSCELLASGEQQIIGPLVPADVNKKNLEIGLEEYERLLGVNPTTAYINEQAVSTGLLDIYLDSGFEAVVVEWDNPYSHCQNWSASDLRQPRGLRAASGRTIKAIWNHAVVFQKLQRLAHGELPLSEYLHFLKKISVNARCFPIYGNDVEIFDFRPGRYKTEAKTHKEESEWSRVTKALTSLSNNPDFEWALPSSTLVDCLESPSLELSNANYPISVKKQAKYNVTRWGLSGRNDLWLNTLCFKEFKRLKQNDCQDKEAWQALLAQWASDLRTHLTDERYKNLEHSLSSTHGQNKASNNIVKPASNKLRIEEMHGHKVRVSTNNLQLILNTYRGIAIDSLSFKEHHFEPVCGTLPHGHFDHIRYGADFYTNHLVLERFRERDRVADLNPCSIEWGEFEGDPCIYARVPTLAGEILKWYRLGEKCLECGFEFSEAIRPEASLRLGFIILKNCKERIWFRSHNGGDHLEHFETTSAFDHGNPVSSIVSSTCALGATEGIFEVGAGNKGVALSWHPEECAALPMASSQSAKNAFFNSSWFSLVESDETLKAGGVLPDFTFTITPIVK